MYFQNKLILFRYHNLWVTLYSYVIRWYHLHWSCCIFTIHYLLPISRQCFRGDTEIQCNSLHCYQYTHISYSLSEGRVQMEYIMENSINPTSHGVSDSAAPMGGPQKTLQKKSWGHLFSRKFLKLKKILRGRV